MAGHLGGMEPAEQELLVDLRRAAHFGSRISMSPGRLRS